MHTEAHPVDRRCQKTRKAIRNAFLRLLGEKEVSRIGVKELTEAADISRKTFYAHYQEPAAVLGEIEDEVVSRLEDALAHGRDVPVAGNAPAFFHSFTRLVQEEFPLFDRLLRLPGGTRLPAKATVLLKKRIRTEYAPPGPFDGGMLDRAVDFVAAGAMSVYLQWFGSDRETPIEEIVDTIGLLARDGVNRLLERKRLGVEGQATC